MNMIRDEETDLHGGVKKSTSADQTHEPVQIKEGDFILVDYTVDLPAEGKVIDTTIEEIARENKIYNENEPYEPALVVVGKGFLLKEVEKQLVGVKVGEEKEIVLPPEKAFGPRDPGKIRVIPAIELSRRGVIPRVGMRVEVNGNIAIVRSVGGGRVQLDFNHPLAGKTLRYRVKIVKILASNKEKIRAIIGRRLRGIEPKDVEITERNKTVYIKLPDSILVVERLGIILRGIALDIRNLLPEEYESVVFSVKLKLKERKPEAKTEAAKTEAKEKQG